MTERRTALSTGREHTGEAQTDKVWRELRAIIAQINASPFASGRLITEEDGAVAGTGLAFTGGTARSIAHRLGRRAKGIVEVYGADLPSSNHVGLRVSAHPSGMTSDTHVTVTSASTGTCWLYVF